MPRDPCRVALQYPDLQFLQADTFADTNSKVCAGDVLEGSPQLARLLAGCRQVPRRSRSKVNADPYDENGKRRSQEELRRLRRCDQRVLVLHVHAWKSEGCLLLLKSVCELEPPACARLGNLLESAELDIPDPKYALVCCHPRRLASGETGAA